MIRDLRKRIDRLEVRMTDGSRLAPESPAWFDFWNDLLDRRDEGEDIELPGEIPWPIISARMWARMSPADRNL
jgi:hypothetical protein